MTVKNNKRTVFGWAMYDWANSAYSTTTVGALMPAYFCCSSCRRRWMEFWWY